MAPKARCHTAAATSTLALLALLALLVQTVPDATGVIAVHARNTAFYALVFPSSTCAPTCAPTLACEERLAAVRYVGENADARALPAQAARRRRAPATRNTAHLARPSPLIMQACSAECAETIALTALLAQATPPGPAATRRHAPAARNTAHLARADPCGAVLYASQCCEDTHPPKSHSTVSDFRERGNGTAWSGRACTLCSRSVLTNQAASRANQTASCTDHARAHGRSPRLCLLPPLFITPPQGITRTPGPPPRLCLLPPLFVSPPQGITLPPQTQGVRQSATPTRPPPAANGPRARIYVITIAQAIVDAGNESTLQPNGPLSCLYLHERPYLWHIDPQEWNRLCHAMHGNDPAAAAPDRPLNRRRRPDPGSIATNTIAPTCPDGHSKGARCLGGNGNSKPSIYKY